jgi:cytochrome c-type biogenesis protein CcmH/NrfG
VEAPTAVPAAPPVALAAEPTAEAAAAPVAELLETAVPAAAELVEAQEAPVDALAARRQHVRDHPRDYAAWLELARLLRGVGERDEALKAYANALRGRDLADSVIKDVETLAAEHPDAASQQLLGDAYMKAGRLQDALRAYRQALQAV